MLKIKEGVNLKTLSNYGFQRVQIDEETKIYQFETSYVEPVINVVSISKIKISIGRIIGVSHSNPRFIVGHRVNDTLFDLIQDGLVEKI